MDDPLPGYFEPGFWGFDYQGIGKCEGNMCIAMLVCILLSAICRAANIPFGGESVPAEHDEEMVLLMQAITDYFAKYPDAADSIDGIRQWWLGQLGLVRSTQQVREALDALCERQSVARTINQSGGIIYSSTSKHKLQ